MSGRIRPPGSKSITIRALITAGLADGRSHLYGALRADDAAAAVDLVRAFGVEVHDESEPWIVVGKGGHLSAPPETINVGLSGLTARIAMVLAAHADGGTTIDARGRLLERPIGGLVDSLEAQGAQITTTDGFLPVRVEGVGGLWGGELIIDSSLTSQFASALMLVAPLMEEGATLILEGLESSHGYVELTARVMGEFGANVTSTITGFEVEKGEYSPTDLIVEPDASAAAYPMVAAAITGGKVLIEDLHSYSKQPDMAVAGILASMGCAINDTDEGMVVEGPSHGLSPVTVNMSNAPDGSLAVAVAAAFADGTSRISGLASLLHKESDRIAALEEGLNRLGANVVADDDTLVISPGVLSGSVIDSHGDHRVAMALAVAGLRVPEVVIVDPNVVSKTWPGYWDAMEALTGREGAALLSPDVDGIIMTIDGPAGSGKSTISKIVAKQSGLPHLDTGAFYRAATLAALRSGVDLNDGDEVARVVEAATFGQEDGSMYLGDEDVSVEIRQDPVTSAVSLVSAYPEVRSLLVGYQRAWIDVHGGRGVVEGRDIGSAVFPDADVKVYLDASEEERARRRAAQTGEDPEAVIGDIARRDAFDSSRKASPLTVPEGAIVIDTTDMSFDEVVEAVLGLIPGNV